MKDKDAILKQLGNYLSTYDTERLHLVMMITPGDLAFTLTVADIVRGFNSSRENEDQLTELLTQLCQIHFKV